MILPDGRVRKTRQAQNEPGVAHELTFCCFQRLPLLNNDRTRQELIAAVEQARKRLGFHLWAYVIMPNHVHILLQPQEEHYEISKILQAIKQPVARQALDLLKACSPEELKHLQSRYGKKTNHHFWQRGGGYDRNILSSQDAWNCVHYLHANPIRRGLVNVATDWLWSSARWYEGLDGIELEMDAMPGG